jgi:hypothetical protein
VEGGTLQVGGVGRTRSAPFVRLHSLVLSAPMETGRRENDL